MWSLTSTIWQAFGRDFWIIQTPALHLALHFRSPNQPLPLLLNTSKHSYPLTYLLTKIQEKGNTEGTHSVTIPRFFSLSIMIEPWFLAGPMATRNTLYGLHDSQRWLKVVQEMRSHSHFYWQCLGKSLKCSWSGLSPHFLYLFLSSRKDG